MKIFKSVKRKFNELNVKENVWLSEIYKNHIKKKFKKKINHNFFFSLLNFLTFYIKKKSIITLDYGGGAGEYYHKYYFNNQKNNKIIILDNNKIIKLGRTKMKYKNITFIDKIENFNFKKINFLLFSSVTQYLENINLELKKLLFLKPDFIIFEDFHATNSKPFVTYQKFFDKKIPVKFHKVEFLEYFMRKNKYSLIYKSSFLPLIKGKFKFYDMENFPKTNRVNHTLNLVFKRNH